VVRIKCFGFGSMGEMMGWSIAEGWRGGSELVLVAWEGSVTRCSGMVTSARGEAALGKGKEGGDTSWANDWAKKWRKSMLSIQLIQMDGEYLKQQ
jgi:hypothetical protein